MPNQNGNGIQIKGKIDDSGGVHVSESRMVEIPCFMHHQIAMYEKKA